MNTLSYQSSVATTTAEVGARVAGVGVDEVIIPPPPPPYIRNPVFKYLQMEVNNNTTTTTTATTTATATTTTTTTATTTASTPKIIRVILPTTNSACEEKCIKITNDELAAMMVEKRYMLDDDGDIDGDGSGSDNRAGDSGEHSDDFPVRKKAKLFDDKENSSSTSSSTSTVKKRKSIIKLPTRGHPRGRSDSLGATDCEEFATPEPSSLESPAIA